MKKIHTILTIAAVILTFSMNPFGMGAAHANSAKLGGSFGGLEAELSPFEPAAEICGICTCTKNWSPDLGLGYPSLESFYVEDVVTTTTPPSGGCSNGNCDHGHAGSTTHSSAQCEAKNGTPADAGGLKKSLSNCSVRPVQCL